MADYKRILIAVDLSRDSAFVFDKAREIGRHQAELSLVHVMAPFPIGYMSSVNFAALNAEMTSQCRGALLELGGVTGIPEHRVHNVMGNTAREIHNLASEINADLIVVGGHGKHGFELLLGSTSSDVAHGVGCDLLIVRIPSGSEPCSK